MPSTMVEGIQSVSQVTSWLVSGRSLFLVIHILGVACFAYIVARRLIPLLKAERDLRFDQPLKRLERVFKFWLGQWKHPRYKTAGTLHILIFAGFILLAVRAFTVLIVGVYLCMVWSSNLRDMKYLRGCYRPFGIQFHVETSLFNVYFAKLDRGTIKPVTMGRQR
jgi:hypothetical protein